MDDVFECNSWKLESKTSEVILYLAQYNSEHYRQKWDLPAELTQPKIAEALGVVRSNISRYLSDLEDRGFIERHIKHILYESRKRSTYLLSPKGMRAYHILKARKNALPTVQ